MENANERHFCNPCDVPETGQKVVILLFSCLIYGALLLCAAIGINRHSKRSITDSLIDERHRHFFYLVGANAAVAFTFIVVGLQGCPGQNDDYFDISGMLLARLLLESLGDLVYMWLWLFQLNYWSQVSLWRHIGGVSLTL